MRTFRRNDDTIWDMTEPASGSPWSKIIYGCIAPAVLLGIGIFNIVTQQATIHFCRHGSTNTQGVNAVLIGLLRISIGFFVHFHYYWTVSEKLWKYSYFAKIMALCIIILFAVCFVIRFFSQ